MCKIFPPTFHGYVRVWYYSLKLGSVLGLQDLCMKLISHFNTSIPTKKSTTKLFVITQRDDENTIAYLQRFNEKTLSVEDLLEPITTKTLINRVYNYSSQEKLYTLPDKDFFSIKHVMDNHIRVKKASMTRQSRPHFHTQEESPSCHKSSTRASKRSTKGNIHDCLTFPKLVSTTPLTLTMKRADVLATVITQFQIPRNCFIKNIFFIQQSKNITN